MFKSFLNEFKKFAMRGNVIDMAVGIIIGAAFGKIVDSLVKDIIMPPVGLLIGSMDFSNLFFVLKDIPGHSGSYASLAQAVEAGATTLNVGNFLNAIISFTIVAFAVFILIKGINKVEGSIVKKEAAALKESLAKSAEIEKKTVELSAENFRQLLIPRGCAHGFVTLTDDVEFLYKADNYYNKASEGSVRWNDPTVGVVWGVDEPVLSDKDKDAPYFDPEKRYF